MTPLIVGIFVAIIVAIMMYIDSRLFDSPKSKLTYFKNMLLSGALGAGIVYLMNGDASSLGFAQSGGSAFVSEINQEILTGLPSF